MKIITGKGREIDYHGIINKSKLLVATIHNMSKIYALCCWSQEKIDYIYCYETARTLDIPFIPLPASIGYNQIISLIESLPFAVAVYKNGHVIRFNESYENFVSDWLALAKLCFFTSGSTGERKLVFLTKENIESAVFSIQERLNYSHEDRVINFLPMTFDYGFYQYLLVKNANATLCFIDEGLSMSSVRQIDTLKITVLPLVPSMVTAFISMRERRFNGNSIKKITSTGEPISASLINQITTLFKEARFYTMYGLTECKRVSILLPEDIPDFKESVGRPISCAEVIINNPDSQGIGEIIVSGTNIALGVIVFSPSGEIRRKDFNGTLNTGDLGLIDSKGFLYVVGRRDSQIKILGQRTSTIEIENAALTVRGIITCKASADTTGCYLQCIVDGPVTVLHIRQSLLKQLGTIASKVVITIVTNLDMTPNYKSKRPN
ncbi:AMP-binding protein [Serratia fonticola]|uniref:AMP-binding protein n=1 Tax=Serratia fonticola TaxID=47917 RepID=UPI00217AD77B|nr:AMP-binding protein [Serratia fonticola]CAI0877209.1 2-succinylbenzoate--CoA ligase [Serratia fonticola]CAI0912285.1 2-succinylbenzoate--CoA ligase [Serratia fonticola]